MNVYCFWKFYKTCLIDRELCGIIYSEVYVLLLSKVADNVSLKDIFNSWGIDIYD